MAKLLWKGPKGDELVDLHALRHSRLPTYLFPQEVLGKHKWASLHLDQTYPIFVPRSIQQRRDSCPRTESSSNVAQLVEFLALPHALRQFLKPTKVQAILSVNAGETVFPQGFNQLQLPHDPDAAEMSDRKSHGRQAIDILKTQLTHANANERFIQPTQDAGLANGEPTNLTGCATPEMDANSPAAQASSPVDNNDDSRSTGSAPSQMVEHDAFDSVLRVSSTLCRTASAPQLQGSYRDDILAGLSGDLTIVTNDSADDDVVGDVFSNDHLSSTIVPLEDPAEALALSQSTVPIDIRQRRSRQLNLLTSGPNQFPTAAVALREDNFPFVEGALLAQANSSYGVIRLSDIPERTRRSEILAIMGRNAKVLNDNQEPVHVIIQRVSGATLEAYVEFTDEKAAEDAIERFEQAKRDGRAPRLGDYPFQYALSSQGALLKALFPQARGVEWINAVPHIIPAHQVAFPWEAFKGFISAEEMHMLAKNAESNKGWTCHQRPYECMISMLRKMPWYMTDHITVFQRQSMYEATMRLIKSLQKQIRYKNNAYVLNGQLLERLWVSAMLCHGFTVTMKDNVAFCVNLSSERISDFNMPRFPNLWVHTHTLVPKPGAPIDVVEWYIAIIRETTTREIERLPTIEQDAIRRRVKHTTLYWGYYWKVLRLTDIMGPAVDNMTLGEMARREFHALTGILNEALCGQEVDIGHHHQQQQQQQQHQALALVAPSQQFEDVQYNGLASQ